LVLAGAGTAAAKDWLPIFRTEHVAPIEFGGADLVALPDLSDYGELVVTDPLDVRRVPDASTAAATTGLAVPDVTHLPRGIRGEPVYRVVDAVGATFTFSTDRASREAVDDGATLPVPPPGLDGSEVRLAAGPGVAAVWSQSTGVPGLVVSRAVAPTAVSSGVAFETIRDYVLSLPGVPAELASRLRTFSPDGSTLPLPIPGERVTTSDADVNGIPATVVATRDRSLAAVVWAHDGVVTVVAGTLDTDEVLSVARGLR
jgi:hypothetical protein